MKVTKEEVAKIIRETAISIERLEKEYFVNNGYICDGFLHHVGSVEAHKIYGDILRNAEILKGIFNVKKYCIRIPNNRNCFETTLRLLGSLGIDVSDFCDLTADGWTCKSTIFKDPTTWLESEYIYLRATTESAKRLFLVKKCWLTASKYTAFDITEFVEEEF